MIQNYLSLKNSINQFNLETSGYAQVQKIYSTRTTLCISLRYPRQTRFLYLGRGAGVEGIWEGKAFPGSHLRCRDRLLEYFRKHLSSGLVSVIELDQLDRIFIIPYTKYGLENFFMYFWHGRKSYLLHAFHANAQAPMKVFTSWAGEIPFASQDNPKIELLALFDELGRTDISKDQGQIIVGDVIQILKKEEESTIRQKLISKKEKTLQRKLKYIHDDLTKVREWENLKKYVKNEELSLDHEKEIKIGSHNFKLQNLQGHHQKVGLIFEKIKKLQKAEKILEERKESTENEIKHLPELILEEAEVKNLAGPKFEIKKIKVDLKNKNDFWKFSLGQKVFAIGKSAIGNDELRTSFAKKDDWWMHLDQKESAHLIIKADWHQLTTEDQRILASALAEYSKINLSTDQLIPIIFTQVKYLKGVKGKAGMVIYKKEKKMSIPSFSDWRNFVTPLFTY